MLHHYSKNCTGFRRNSKFHLSLSIFKANGENIFYALCNNKDYLIWDMLRNVHTSVEVSRKSWWPTLGADYTHFRSCDIVFLSSICMYILYIHTSQWTKERQTSIFYISTMNCCSPKSSPHYYCINYYAVFRQKWQPPVEAVWAAIRFELFHEAHRNRNEWERKAAGNTEGAEESRKAHRLCFYCC